MLQLENVSVARGGVQVLSGVNCQVAAGQALILRGPNGIGKTTVLRAIAGLQPITKGRIHCDADIAYAGHLDAIKPTLTVLENLSFWAAMFGTGHGIIAQVLDEFNLNDLRDRMAGNLSAGQKRRLGLARLPITDCKVWVLDEPTVSLDHDNVAIFCTALMTFLTNGGAAVVATHIDFGLQTETLDLTPYKSKRIAITDFDEAFL